MATVRERVAVGLAAGGVLWGLNTMLQPGHDDPDPARSPAGTSIQQDLEDLADADEISKNRMRDEGNDLIDGNLKDELNPSERRPPEAPRLRIR